MKIAHIAESIGGTLVGNPDLEITGVAGIRDATPADLTFLANPRYESYMDTTLAGVVVVGPNGREYTRTVIRVDNPVPIFPRLEMPIAEA